MQYTFINEVTNEKYATNDMISAYGFQVMHDMHVTNVTRTINSEYYHMSFYDSNWIMYIKKEI